MKKKLPLTFEHHGLNLVLIRPTTERAREWLKTRLETESWQWSGSALAVDPAYADDIARMAAKELR